MPRPKYVEKVCAPGIPATVTFSYQAMVTIFPRGRQRADIHVNPRYRDSTIRIGRDFVRGLACPFGLGQAMVSPPEEEDSIHVNP